MPTFLFGQSGTNVGPVGALREIGLGPDRPISPSDKPVPDAGPAGGLGQLFAPATTGLSAAQAAAQAGADQGRATLEQLDRNKPKMADTDP